MFPPAMVVAVRRSRCNALRPRCNSAHRANPLIPFIAT